MNINYIKFGNGKRNMLILPGLSIRSICDSHEGVIEAYSTFSDDFTIYLFDQRNDLLDTYDFDQMVDDVYTKINELNLSDIYLYGVSMGGTMSLLLAFKYPELIKKLVLVSTYYQGTDIFSIWKKYSDDKDAEKLVSSFMDNVYSVDFNHKYKEYILEAYKDINDEEFRKFGILTQALINLDVSEKLKDIGIETLVLGSKKDQVFPYVGMKDMASSINAESYFYDNYSHAVYDEAEDIKERIKRFFLK